MNWIRTLVSGDKIRVKDGNINLDLSYITDRIIGKKKKGNERIFTHSLFCNFTKQCPSLQKVWKERGEITLDMSRSISISTTKKDIWCII